MDDDERHGVRVERGTPFQRKAVVGQEPARGTRDGGTEALGKAERGVRTEPRRAEG